MSKMWLLDFDGVINAFGSKNGDRTVHSDWKKCRINGFEILYSPTVIDCIRETHEAGVDVRWLSTWCADTVQFQHHIPNLPVLPWLDNPDGTDRDGWTSIDWKVRAATAHVPTDADVMWTEDEKVVTGEYGQPWITSRTGPTTVINPHPHHGLTPKHLTTIREWINS